jgi:Na+-driven multidrug efflux pump
MGMFVDSSSNQSVIDIGVEYLRVVSLFYFFMGLMVVTNGVLRGAGDIKAFLTSTLTNLSIRIIFAYGIAFLIGQKAIWWAVPLGWIFASTVSVARYKSEKWKGKAVV